MNRELIVTLGSELFRVVGPWGSLPRDLRFHHVSGVGVDQEDNVFVLQRSRPPILRFDADGHFVKSWGADVLVDPHGIVLSDDGRVVVVDRNAHQVLVFDKSGTLLQKLGDPRRPRFQLPFSHPTSAVIAPNGDLFVADGYGNAAVHRFSPDGQLRRSWGTFGRHRGEFRTPHAIRASEQRVFIADRENDRVQIFTHDGEIIGEWDTFFRPMDICFGSGGGVYVSDQVPSITKLSSEGRIEGRCSPVETMAHSLACDSTGNIYLAEFSISRVSKLVLESN